MLSVHPLLTSVTAWLASAQYGKVGYTFLFEGKVEFCCGLYGACAKLSIEIVFGMPSLSLRPMCACTIIILKGPVLWVINFLYRLKRGGKRRDPCWS